jgi:broad specificity phosphatase PhoE
MGPDGVIVIRHGEKPTPDGSIQGVDRFGAQNEHELSVRGWQRAGALGRFFRPVIGDPQAPLAVPTALYAPHPSEAEPSKRAKHTLRPLSELLGIKVDTSFEVGEEEKLARAMRRASGTLLVAWEHRRIADIVSYLTDGQVTSPHWPKDRFDMTLVIEAGQSWRLTQVPQLLLAGDRKDPLPLDSENGADR